MKFKYISPSIEAFLGKGVIEEAKMNSFAPFECVHPDDYEILCKKVKGEIDYSQILIQQWKDNTETIGGLRNMRHPFMKTGN
ncbi:hypothetical protein [Neobacillus terrae]|uniref:hypothetical protein n=1 Tax=Neobacillus terrae TaxID=3034837 RepID=UPI0014089F74|nr:hypothetical protein [Neobacillus terrae]NHM33730.1 hypothetical protein [Neobacillus terrae]